MSHVTVALCLGLLASAATPQQVWVVDDTEATNPDFAHIQPAINAAADGDTILVREGEYPTGFAIDGKALTVAADAGASVHLEGFRVRNLAADQSVTLMGLQAGPGPSFLPAVNVIRIIDCAGPVLLQDLSIDGSVSFGVLPLEPTVAVTHCAGVTFENCQITGRKNTLPLDAADGLTAEALVCTTSQVQLAHGSVVGAPGNDAHEQGIAFFGAVAGDDAIRLVNSRLILLGNSVTGGEGGQGGYNSFVHGCTQGAAGGAAVVSVDAGSEVVTRATVLAGGAGGTGGFNVEGGVFCSDGPAGAATAGPGVVTALPGDGQALEIRSAVVREGGTSSLTLHGSPGSGALLIVAIGQSQLWMPGHAGVLLPQPLLLVPLGTVPASGALAVHFEVPILPFGVEAVVPVMQAAFTRGGPAVLGGGGALVILDASF